MPIELLMPALSPTMTEGNLAKWHKKEGDAVKAGEVIAEIETDKATMEFEAVDEGTLGRILVPEGTQGVKVNQPIALLLEEGEDAKALGAPKPVAAKPAPAPAAAAPAPAPAAAPVAPQPKPAPVAATPAAPAGNGHGGARVFASPLARRLAEQNKLDLARVAGTGPHGRIVRADVEAAMKGGTALRGAPATARGPSAPSAPSYNKAQIIALAGNIPYTETPLTGMRRTIAARLAESEVVPHYFITVDCEIDALMKARADINDALGVKLSVNDFVLKATALALRKVPTVNASWSEDAILHWQDVHVAVAVALPEGLITPIIKNADKKSIPTISAEMRELGQRAKDGKLKLDEFQGGTISVSNLGMFGTKHFTAVINPPQSCIVAIGAGEKRPVVRGDALAVATVMTCTGTFDHRVVDGAVGAQFMAAFKKLIEAPAALLI
jgi:pyruvate dehydrogenase E2 component (dihydrolipoamide acetyltransferase)